jgi:hypothetical protein
MTQLPPGTIPQTQDELRDRFVYNGLQNTLSTSCTCDPTDPFNLGLDDWGKTVVVRREDYKDRETKERVAIIYWTKDENELIVNVLVDEGVRYQWNYVPATKAWSSYNYQSEA